jgi:hypothetical protein
MLIEGGHSTEIIINIINSALRHEDAWGSESKTPPFLISALDGVESSVSCSGRLAPREIPPVHIG